MQSQGISFFKTWKIIHITVKTKLNIYLLTTTFQILFLLSYPEKWKFLHYINSYYYYITVLQGNNQRLWIK